MTFVTRPKALNLTIFLFIYIDSTSRLSNPPLANAYHTNTSLNTSTNAHFNAVLSLKKEEKSVDCRIKVRTTLDSDDKDLAKRETWKSSDMVND